MSVVCAALSLTWIATALALARFEEFSAARRTAAGVLGLSALATAAVWWATLPATAAVVHEAHRSMLTEQRFLGIVPVIISVIGLVAITLSDSLSHTVTTLRRIMALLAVAVAFVAVRDIVFLAALWALSPLVAWDELRSRPDDRGVARLFAAYHLPSIVLFGAGATFDAFGWPAVAMAVMLVAIGIREAAIPGHSWFPRFVERAPMGLVVAFVAPQLGVYAHLEVLGPHLGADTGHLVAAFGALTAIVAATLGVVQTDARRALAFLMMSQTGLVSFGLEGASTVAHAGSLLNWQVLAIATSGFAMTLSALEARRGPLSLSTHSGCFARTPRMAAGFMVMGLASVGFPLTLGFVAEDLLVQGAMETVPLLAFVLIAATALNGMTVMRAFFRLFSGRRVHSGEGDLTSREAWVLSLVLLMLLVGGAVPGWITMRAAGPPHSDAIVQRTVDALRTALVGTAETR